MFIYILHQLAIPLVEQLEKLDQRMKFCIAEGCFLNEFSISKSDTFILHRTLLLNCPLQNKGQGMEWVRGMGNGNGGLRDSALFHCKGHPLRRLRHRREQVGAAFVFVCRRPVLGIGVNFDFLDFLDFCQFPAGPGGPFQSNRPSGIAIPGRRFPLRLPDRFGGPARTLGAFLNNTQQPLRLGLWVLLVLTVAALRSRAPLSMPLHWTKSQKSRKSQSSMYVCDFCLFVGCTDGRQACRPS